jgi:hypothetical protein
MTAVLAVAVGLVGPAGVAFAGSGDTPPPPASPTTAGTAIVHRCVLYANASGFGADCAGTRDGQSIEAILHGEKFAECRYDPLPGDVTAPDTHAGEKGAWWLETCLRGIKPDGTGDFTRTVEVVWIDVHTRVPTLTQNQARAWSVYRTAYPQPFPSSARRPCRAS